jgi:hypothetical protein
MYRNYKEIRKYSKNIGEKSERKGKNTKKKKETPGKLEEDRESNKGSSK